MTIEDIKNWFLRIIYCHHNGRVIADFEDRMSAVIYEATNGRMSKSYYPKETMIAEIRNAFEDHYNEGQKDAVEILMPSIFEIVANSEAKEVKLNAEQLKQFQEEYNEFFKAEGRFMTDAVRDGIKAGRASLFILGKKITYEE